MILEAWDLSGVWLHAAAWYGLTAAFLSLRLLIIYTVLRLLRAGWRSLWWTAERRQDERLKQQRREREARSMVQFEDLKQRLNADLPDIGA